jgi:hypothetical protein
MLCVLKVVTFDKKKGKFWSQVCYFIFRTNFGENKPHYRMSNSSFLEEKHEL